MQCNPSTNSSGNLSQPPVDQRITYVDFLYIYKFYVGFGCFAMATNAISILVILSKKQLREKYGSFGFLSFGDMLNALSLAIAGAARSQLINANVYFPLNSFACFGRPWPYFFIVGGQLPCFILLVMSAERLYAICRPIIYRARVTARTRTVVNVGCVVLSVISLVAGIGFSYLSRSDCESAACTVIGATGRIYGTFNYIVIVSLPFIAFLLNCIGLGRAWSTSASANMRQELKKIFATMVIAAFAVVLGAVPSIFLWGQGVYWTVTNISTSVLFLGFCSNSAINFITFIILKKDFRNRFLSLISYGYLNRYFSLPVGTTGPPNQRNAQTNFVRRI